MHARQVVANLLQHAHAEYGISMDPEGFAHTNALREALGAAPRPLPTTANTDHHEHFHPRRALGHPPPRPLVQGQGRRLAHMP